MSQTFPPVRLAALDLDGTLLSGHSEVTPRTRQALARAAANGVVIVPATGRPLASLPPIVATLPGVRYALTSNGAAVWDLHNDPLGAVYSRYANAAEHETSEPEAVLHDLMPQGQVYLQLMRAHFGLPLQQARIQPLWLRVVNRSARMRPRRKTMAL